MGKKVNKLLSFILVLAMIFTSVPVTGFTAQAAEGDSASTQEYKIYPTPHDIAYADGELVLGDSANLVVESTIDEATVNRAKDVLNIKNITATKTDSIVSGKLNVLVGTNGSGGAVENWFKENVTIADGFFDHRDAYVLSIQDGVIAVLGKDTDAAFYGLSSLKMIFEQSEASVRKLQINDWAEGQYRGFIEGYYGIPWSVEDRISLMKFGGDFKMNIYIYAPKDEPYHNSKWRELYPDDKLEEIREMVQAGQAAKCRFAWAIHPFMHDAITSSNYDESLAVIKAKFQQLYDVGVRQFVISADDASGKVSLHARLCKDMTEWVKEHEGTYNLVFVPQVYCSGAVTWSNWTENGEAQTVQQYFSHFQDNPDLELMWTGEYVCHPVTQYTLNNFKSKAGREAFMWLNWPVNDVNHARLVMGPGTSEILEPGATNFKGIVTNPLEQGEASKTALFAIADYAWNTTDFDAEQSWADSFQYIDKGAPEAMHELCKHLTNPSPGGITRMGESVELTPYITAFTKAYGDKDDITESGNALIEQLEKIVAAADEFQTNGTNVNLQDEMKPWVDSLRYLSKAVIAYIRTAIAIQNKDDEEIWNNYHVAISNYTNSKNCIAPQLSGTIKVEAGAMKIMPLASQLDSSVKKKALEVLNNNFSIKPIDPDSGDTGEAAFIYDGVGGVYEGRVANATDGDDSSYVWFNQEISNGNAYVGMDLGKVYKLDTIRILQGKNDTHGDIFDHGVLEYSLDNENWTTVGTYGTNTIEVSLLDQSLKARYVRLRSGAATDKWYAIREFSVTTQAAEDFVYTNAETLKEKTAIIDKNSAAINAIEEDITLKNGEYIGLEFPKIREVTSFTADYTNKDALTLEYSYNGFNWYDVTGEGSFDAKYIRIINKGDSDVTFKLNSFSLENSSADRTIFATPAGKEGHEITKAVDNSLLTSFEAENGAGSLSWRLVAGYADSLYVLQDAAAVSNAKVSVHTNEGEWIEVGTLSKGLNIFKNLVFYGEINEVKIEWTETAPVIYEMYTKETTETPETALQAAIDAAEVIRSSQVTDESFAALQEALNAAKTVNANPESTVAERRAAKEALDAAMAALVWLEEPKDYEKLPTRCLTGSADSEEPTGEGEGNGIVGAAIDGDTSTYWHTNWSDGVKAEYDGEKLTGNNTYTLTLDKPYLVAGLTYLPRQTRDNNGALKNGAILECNVYVSTDNGETYTKVAEGVEWDYTDENPPQEKTAEFDPVAGVTNVKIEAIHTAGDQPNMFINAAELNVLAKEMVAPEGIVSAPTITYTVPNAGKVAQPASFSYLESENHFDTIADYADDPATLTLENVEVAYDGAWGYSGLLTAENDGLNNDKFDVSGANNALFIRFRMKSPQISDGGTYQILGKMDEQYGVQIKSDCVLVFAHDANGSWVESNCPIDDTFWDEWHDVVVAFTGTKMQIYVDGVAGAPTSGRPNEDESHEVVLGSYSSSIFTTGYNGEKGATDAAAPCYTGKLADVRLYSGEDYSNGLSKSYAGLANALDKAVPFANLTLMPYRASTTWYKGETALGDDEAFEEGAVYKVETVLTALGGYQFSNDSRPATVTLSDGTKVEPETKVSADGTTMTVSYTFEEAEAVCSCEITKVNFSNTTAAIRVPETSKTITLVATAETADCVVHEEKNVTYTYSIVDAGTTGAVLDGDQLTVTAAGKAKVKVVVGLNGKTAEKEITVTVTSNVPSAEEKAELQTKITEAKDMDKALYTEDSYKNLETAIANAESVLGDAASTKTDVTKALKALENAVKNLVTVEEVEIEEIKQEIATAVNESKDVLDAGQGEFTKESWDAFVAAYEAAANVPENATSAELKTLLAKLQEAKAGLTTEKPAVKLQAPTIKSVKATAGTKGVNVKVTVNPVNGASAYAVYRIAKGKTAYVGTTAAGKLYVNDAKTAAIKNIKSAQYYAVAISKDSKFTNSDNGKAVKLTFASKTKLKKAVRSGKSVKLTWKRNKSASGYAIYRSTKKSSGYKRVKVIKKGKTTSYTFKKVSTKKTYYYKIVTIGKKQASPMSAPKSVKKK